MTKRTLHALLIFALMLGAARGWMEYMERDADFNRAAAKYRAVRAAYFAMVEAQRALVGATPCDEYLDELPTCNPAQL